MYNINTTWVSLGVKHFFSICSDGSVKTTVSQPDFIKKKTKQENNKAKIILNFA